MLHCKSNILIYIQILQPGNLFLEEFTMQHSLNHVRMIATDMDGTLLNSQDQMPRDFFDILNQVHKLGILFVIASGRPYPTLAMQFESCMDKLVFMAENGGCLVNGDHLVHQDILDTDALSYLLGAAVRFPAASDSLRFQNGLSLRSDIG